MQIKDRIDVAFSQKKEKEEEEKGKRKRRGSGRECPKARVIPSIGKKKSGVYRQTCRIGSDLSVMRRPWRRTCC